MAEHSTARPRLTTAYAAALILSCFLSAPDLPATASWWQRALLFGTGLLGIIAVQLFLFLTYDVGWVQGRYLVPFVAVLAFACGGFVIRSAPIRRVALAVCLAIAAATHVAALLAIARASGA